MGLETRQAGNYITILGGRLCQRVQEGTEGAETRVNKINKTVHEKFYTSFTGKLIDIQVKDGEYGKTWNFHFRDKEEVYILQLSYSNSFSTAFLKILPNIDLTKEFKLSPSTKEEDGKKKSSLFINQGGSALKHAYTRAVPNGMPDMEQVEIKGEKVWDDTKRLVFLQNMVDTIILPKLKALAPAPVAQVTPSVAQVQSGLQATPATAVGQVTDPNSDEALVAPFGTDTQKPIEPEDVEF